MICPNCGEDNSSNFRYCGMCGTPLEARRPAGAPRVAGPAEAARTAQNGATEPRTPAAKAVMGASQTVSPTSGPSFLGLNRSADEPDGNRATGNAARDHSFSHPPFSHHDSFFEPEERGIGARRIFLLLVLLAGLGVAGRWAFSNYDKMGAAVKSKSPDTATKADGTGTTADNAASNAKSSPDKPALPDAGSAQPAAAATTPAVQPSPAVVVQEKAQQKAPPKAEKKVPQASVAEKPAEKAQALPEQKIARADASAAPRAPSIAPAADDKGDAAFRKGEAYLYGRGVRENCDEAEKNLRAASAKQNAKARSTLGTMYATGHCVARDLPTSYSWFALALRADPNNQILEKDLVAVWNQMTPPERQMAAKMKK